MGLEHPNILHPSISLPGMSTDDIAVSCGPSAQLLVIPAALARHLNMSHPLTLLVDEKQVCVKPEQLKVSGVGLNITLPMGSVPDAFVEGPGKPLEFRVVSTAESGRQAVAVSLFERPLRLSSALEAFSTNRADPIVVSELYSVGLSDSGITTNSNESNIMTLDPATGVVKHDKIEGNLESRSGKATGSAKCDEFLTSDEAKSEAVASTVGEGVAERKTMVATENVDMKEELDLEISESNTGISSKVSSGKIPESENMVTQKELGIESSKSPTESDFSSLETGKEVMEEPKADVSMETECFLPGSPIDTNNKTNTLSCERSDGNDRDSCGEKSANSNVPVACSTEESIKERDIATVVGNSSATSCDESHEKDGANTLKGNPLESTELKEEMESSIKTDVMSATEVISLEGTNAGHTTEGSTL